MKDPRREPSGDRLAPKAVVGRLSLYLRQLEAFLRLGQGTISSSQLGSPLGISDAQVRKDLAFFGQFGYPGIGYRCEELIPALRQIMGLDREWPLALIGVGNLGCALLKYRVFLSRGFHVVTLFDNDPRKIGQSFEGLIVQPVESLRQAVVSHGVSMGVLTVPAEAAQRVADEMVACGIVGILNFAPVALVVPPTVSVVAVDLSVQLQHLAYNVQNAQRGVSFVG